MQLTWIDEGQTAFLTVRYSQEAKRQDWFLTFSKSKASMRIQAAMYTSLPALKNAPRHIDATCQAFAEPEVKRLQHL